MLDKVFNYTGRDLIKLSIMIVVATLLFGLPGLIILIFLQWLTNRSYALESADKHGISKVAASRLGGVAIFGSSFVLYLYGSYVGLIDISKLSMTSLIMWVSVFFCMVLGMIDDFKSDFLSPKVRFICIFIIFSVCFCIGTELIPQRLGVWGIDFFLDNAISGWMLTVIFCVGFVNAMNMADGANGLIPGTITIAFIIFYAEVGFVSYAIFIVTCGLFTIFNVISGRLFLGDAGAYGLGSVLALNGLYLFSQGIFSASFLAVLFSYPCIDIIATVSRRRLQRKSILLPDNDHLHNRVYFHCRRWFRSKTLANSMTGILIVSCSSGVALFGFIQQWWPLTSNHWMGLFLLQCVLYLMFFFLTGLNRSSNHHVMSQ